MQISFKYFPIVHWSPVRRIFLDCYFWVIFKREESVFQSTHFHFPLDHMHISSPLHFHFSADHGIYLHRTLVERFAEESVSSPIFPLGINQPSGKVPTLSNQHLPELSKYFIRPLSLSSQTNFSQHLKSFIIYFNF